MITGSQRYFFLIFSTRSAHIFFILSNLPFFFPAKRLFFTLLRGVDPESVGKAIYPKWGKRKGPQMGDVNHLLFVQKYRHLLRAPYLEVGSKDYGSTQNLRSLVSPAEEYLGVDQVPGPQVDLLLDLTLPFHQVDTRLGSRRFGTIFCFSVLEHCEAPWRMAENLTRLLKPGGVLFISAPFAWKFHAYPNDYWRFTPEGIRCLFSQLWFDPYKALWATSRPGDFYPLDPQLGKIRFRTTPYRQTARWAWAGGVVLLRMLRQVGLLGFLKGFSYLLAPTNIMMVGQLPEESAFVEEQIKASVSSNPTHPQQDSSFCRTQAPLHPLASQAAGLVSQHVLDGKTLEPNPRKSEEVGV